MRMYPSACGDTPEERAAYYKLYRAKNLKKIRKKDRIRARRDSARNKIRSREWYFKNRELQLLKFRTYRLENLEKKRLADKKWRLKNLELVRKYDRERNKLRWKNSTPEFRLRAYMRTRIFHCLKGRTKHYNWSKSVGCTREFLMAHLQSLFQPGMNWNNYGKWHVDHVRPCASFDLSKPEEQLVCFHWSNLQPLWAIDNLRKNDRIINV